MKKLFASTALALALICGQAEAAPDIQQIATVTAVNQAVVINTEGKSNVGVHITANTNVTFGVKGTINGTDYVTAQAYPVGGPVGSLVSTITGTGVWVIPSGGLFQKVELVATAVGATPTASVFMNAGSGDNTLANIAALQSAPSCVAAVIASLGINGQQLTQGCGVAGGLIVQNLGAPGVPVTGHSGNVAAASAVATLTATASTTAYITGFQCTAGGATVAADVSVTVAGVIGGTMTYTASAPTGITVAMTPLIVTFPNPVPASAVNTNIIVTMPSLGTGNTNASCNAQGFLF